MSSPGPRLSALRPLADDAYIYCYVEDTEKELPGNLDGLVYIPDPQIVLEIADCSRRINLELNLGSRADRANSLHKIDTLLGTLRRFKRALEAEAILRQRIDRERGRR